MKKEDYLEFMKVCREQSKGSSSGGPPNGRVSHTFKVQGGPQLHS